MRIRFFLLALFAIATPALTMSAQRSRVDRAADESTEILIAAVGPIRGFLPADSVLIDVKDGTGDAAARATAVARAVGARAGKTVRQCSGAGTPDTCHLLGAVGVIELMGPVVRGDTALVRVRLMQETANRRQPIFYAEYAVTVARMDGKWVAIRTRATAMS